MNKASTTAREVLSRLKSLYPEPHIALHWKTPWQLLVASVLSAQSTDKQINKITPKFFARWPNPAALSRARLEEVQDVIRPAGFYRVKAKNLINSANMVTRKFNGLVPASMNELLLLPGVARKTANVILFNAFGISQGIAVDTHVRRISLRLKLTESDNPVRIEKDLMDLFPESEWGILNQMMVLFGREICKAKKPLCSSCPLADICPSSRV